MSHTTVPRERTSAPCDQSGFASGGACASDAAISEALGATHARGCIASVAASTKILMKIPNPRFFFFLWEGFLLLCKVSYRISKISVLKLIANIRSYSKNFESWQWQCVVGELTIFRSCVNRLRRTMRGCSHYVCLD